MKLSVKYKGNIEDCICDSPSRSGVSWYNAMINLLYPFHLIWSFVVKQKYVKSEIVVYVAKIICRLSKLFS